MIPEMCLYAADDVSTGDCICVGRGSPSDVGSRLPPFRAKRLDDRDSEWDVVAWRVCWMQVVSLAPMP